MSLTKSRSRYKRKEVLETPPFFTLICITWQVTVSHAKKICGAAAAKSYGFDRPANSYPGDGCKFGMALVHVLKCDPQTEMQLTFALHHQVPPLLHRARSSLLLYTCFDSKIFRWQALILNLLQAAVTKNNRPIKC